MSPANEYTTDVLIVGAGPVGLALAVELGHRGLRCIVVEKNDRVGTTPRAKLTNTRTREHLRRWGIAERLREVSPIPRDYPARVVFATRLTGFPLAVFENALNCSHERSEAYSESAQWVPQSTLEETLLEHARSFPTVTIRFNAQLESLEQSEDETRGEIVDTVTGERFAVRAPYAVGADGVRSPVRHILGFAMEGKHALARFYNIIMIAPQLASAHGLGRAIQYWSVNRELPVVLGPMDDGAVGTWFVGIPIVPGGPDVENTDARTLVRMGTGLDLDIEVVATDPWVSHSLMATRYRDRRIFLAGDACHTHPPFGGYGMNMGIGDGVDLGWKLAAVLQGWGGEALLESYETERRQVHRLVLDEAVANQRVLGNHLVREGIEDDGPEGERIRAEVGDAIRAGKRREFDTNGVVLGYRYEGSPIIASDGSPPPDVDYSTYTPSARPGSVAPHTWLRDDSSLYDHFGDGFTLLVTSGAPNDAVARFADAAAARNVPLTVFAPGEARVAELYETRYALVRPDQHVAWRGDDLPADPTALIAHITGGLTVAEPVGGPI